MPRGRKRILSPPPQRRPPLESQPNASTEVGTDGGRGSAGVWWEGASTDSPAASSSHAFHTEKPSDNVAAAEFSSPTTDAHNWGKDYRSVGGFLNYWGDVATFYNSTTQKNRRRLVKQAKDHWHKLNKWVNEFQCSWLKASRIYTSGQSDDQLMDKAHRIYELWSVNLYCS